MKGNIIKIENIILSSVDSNKSLDYLKYILHRHMRLLLVYSLFQDRWVRLSTVIVLYRFHSCPAFHLPSTFVPPRTCLEAGYLQFIFSVCCLLLILFDLVWHLSIQVYQKKDPTAGFPLQSSPAPPPWIPYCKLSVLDPMACISVLSLSPHRQMTASCSVNAVVVGQRCARKHASFNMTDVNQHCRDRGQLAAIQAQIVNFRRCYP